MIVSISAFYLSGCATPIAPNDLKSVSVAQCIVIGNKTTWSEQRGMMGLTWEQGVAAGVYKSEFEDEYGIYFRGNGRPVWLRAFPTSDPNKAGNKTPISEGGIWISKFGAAKPKLYHYLELEQHYADDVNKSAFMVASNYVNQGVGIGPSVVGAAIGGAIANAMIKADAGKILFFPEVMDPDFISKIQQVGPCPTSE